MLLLALLALQAAAPRFMAPVGQTAIVTTQSDLRFEVLEPGRGAAADAELVFTLTLHRIRRAAPRRIR